MIKLMIVDDEAVIRHGLRQAVDWEQYDITIAREAKNGRIALEKSAALQPDIVISDIRMPDGDGIEFVKNLLEILPHIKIIMLSGYSDMEYMMEAIKLGVRDYLLKPAGTLQILQSVLKQRDEIYREREQRLLDAQRETLLNENLGALKSEFMAELLDGRISAEMLEEKAALLQLSFPGPYYMTFSAAAGFGHEWELLQLLSCMMEDYSPIIDASHRDMVVVAVLNTDAPIPDSKLLEVVERIRPLTDPMTLPCVTALHAPLHELHELHGAARQLMTRSIWFDSPFLRADGSIAFEPIPHDSILAHERDIVAGVRDGNPDSIRESIDGLFETLRQNQPAIEDFQDIILGIVHSICVFSENSAALSNFKEHLDRPYTVEEIKSVMLSMLSSDYAKYGPQIKNALAFLEQSYMNDITLSDAASALYISPSYLTRLLKSKTGMGFSEWLHTIRIEKAKKLLGNPGLRHYEIAEMVGYKSYKIFSEYFVKIAGCNARKFREMNLRIHN